MTFNKSSRRFFPKWTLYNSVESVGTNTGRKNEVVPHPYYACTSNTAKRLRKLLPAKALFFFVLFYTKGVFVHCGYDVK